MRGHQYRITIEALADDAPPARTFTASCHDELLGLLDRVGTRAPLTADESAAMLTGLKLLGEVAMNHRREAPFSELHPHLGAFIMALKGKVRASRDGDAQPE